MESLRQDADHIIAESIRAVQPDAAVRRALAGRDFGTGRLVLVAVGKAAWQMASSAADVLGNRIGNGIVITKYGHSRGAIRDFCMVEAEHPIPDGNSFAGTRQAPELVQGLSLGDQVLFLLSGGGSALFEDPLIPPDMLADLTGQLLACGADIVEINTLRKRVSRVKGGRFALCCAPAQVYAVILSDILGEPVDMIASGPVSPDSSTAEDAWRIVEKYSLKLPDAVQKCLTVETPKTLDHVETMVTGTAPALDACGVSIFQVLRENDAYHALDQVGGLIRTGATGTNVNDVAVVLIR